MTALFVLELLEMVSLLGLSSANQSLKNCHNYIKARKIQFLSKVANHQSGGIKPSNHIKIKSDEVSFVFM